jgi:FkbM family methyltransferase
LHTAIRLYSGLGFAFVARLVLPTRFKSSGYWIPGNSNLTVLTSGALAKVRPRTTDLAVLAGSQEPETVTWLQPREGDIVVDVGAHIGRYTLMAAQRGARVVAIEPEPSNFSLLRENIELNSFSNVTTCQCAVSDTSGRKVLFLGDNGPGDTATSSFNSALMQERSGRALPRYLEQVECETLDNLLKSLEIHRVDWLKVDVEFHELQVLRGARSTLLETQNLIIEVTRSNQEACRRLATDAGLVPLKLERNTGWEVDNWWYGRR